MIHYVFHDVVNCFWSEFITRTLSMGNNFSWRRHILFISLDTGRGIGIKTCWVDNVLLPDELRFGSNTNTNCAVKDSVYLDIKLMGLWIEFRCPTLACKWSLLWFRETRRQPRNMVSSVTCTGLASKADCLFRIGISQGSPNSSHT